MSSFPSAGIQTSAIQYRLDTPQTRRPFYLSFRFNYQLQVQICSKHGCHSDLYTNSLIIPSAVATEVILSLIQIPVIVSDILKTRKSFCYSYKPQLLKTVSSRSTDHRVLPNMDANLSLVQIQLLKTVYRRFQNTDANLLLIHTPSSETFQTWIPC